jgi:hypothetical protein
LRQLGALNDHLWIVRMRDALDESFVLH